MAIDSAAMPKDEFIRKVLERDARNIYRAQQLVVSQRIYLAGKDLKASRRQKGLNRQSGVLENSLANPDYYLRSEGETFNIAANYPIYIRFLDMKSKGNWKLYNRIIWGVLYNNALKDIRFGYGKEIRDWVGTKLREAFEKYNK